MKLKLIGLAALAMLSAAAFSAPPAPVCPIMGNAIPQNAPRVQWGGLDVAFCCAGCDTEFLGNPRKYLAAAAEKGTVVAISFFNPVSGKRAFVENNPHVVDYSGVRYPLASAEEVAEFRATPELFTRIPARESLTCPVMQQTVPQIRSSSGYADYQGVRYYFCCLGCDVKFAEDPAKYAATVTKAVRAVGGGQVAMTGQHTMMPTCAGCAGEARMLTDGKLDRRWTLGYRFIGSGDISWRHRFTLDYAVNPRLSVGIERAGAGNGVHAGHTPEFGDDPWGYLRLSTGDAPILPRFTWFVTPETAATPSVVFGTASDRLSTPRGQAFFTTFGKAIPDSIFFPFVSIKVNSEDGKTVFPFGVNTRLAPEWVLQTVNDGDYTHWLLTRMGRRESVSLLWARSRYWGFSMSVGF